MTDKEKLFRQVPSTSGVGATIRNLARENTAPTPDLSYADESLDYEDVETAKAVDNIENDSDLGIVDSVSEPLKDIDLSSISKAANIGWNIITSPDKGLGRVAATVTNAFFNDPDKQKDYGIGGYIKDAFTSY